MRPKGSLKVSNAEASNTHNERHKDDKSTYNSTLSEAPWQIVTFKKA